MGKVRVAGFSLSLDGYGAGLHQDLENPIGVRGLEIMRWFFETKVFQAMHGQSGGAAGVDNDFASRAFENVGAWILGRNMFGPIRGTWGDESWKGWWGDTPPYHTPVFVLTHYARAPLVMNGGTTFYFVTDGLQSALEQAREAANGKDVRIGGGVSTIRGYLRMGAIDEMHLVLSPVLLGEGEHLFGGLNLPQLGFGQVEAFPGENATHMVLKKS
ncbi:dihydrofolate reductase family protein [Silvibacterium dinghuense]|uniref:Dihydrofolate reductase n=1 Tax=Silvibacterium dinghuense TaxID=1560006 RepID=A0A4Q1SEA1_9BACT|nr:dihydrofolate reductase family protein [Silvibacterium dinghuense]RXS95425.1 dihydrofolate reductase [Silvibacterium dinghuense]GGH13112.1 DNA-binding protein [Silvibacterium dinghuense]